MRNVRCPRCSHVNQASGSFLTCKKCGLSGSVGTASGAAKATEKDPWTITIDLRKANPGNWGPGAKAFAVLLMLGLAFFAGGISGVVFERARSGVISDLSSGGLLSGDNAATGPDLSDAEQLIDDTPDPTPEPEPTPEAPAPDASSCSGKMVQGACVFSMLQGSAGDGPYTIQLTQAILGMQIDYSGDGQFRMKFENADGERRTLTSDFDARSNQNYQAQRYIGLAEGEWTVEVSVTKGSWIVYLAYPPAPSSPGSAYAGNGDGAIKPVTLGPDDQLTMTTQEGPKRTYVRGYDATGAEVCSNGFGQAGGTTEKFTCDVAGPTAVYLDIQAWADTESPDRDTWRLDIN